MDLRCRLDEILQVCSQQEVTQVNELAVVLVLDVDHTPSVLSATDLLSVDDDRLLGANDSKGNKVLQMGVSYAFKLCIYLVNQGRTLI